ncbi:MAG TPA: serine/threonine-protein kinase [Solirubrobacterales bacterium]|nr:serine/threonine-protein kinase [Solirubrobacterales bacterium]
MVEPRDWSELSAGDEFAGYRVEERLGRGGMGILYLAVEPGLERRVALKLIAPEAAADEVFAKRFAEESRIAAAIEHPNVVPIYAAGEEAGVPFIAMRFVSGSDLNRRLAEGGRLEPQRAVALTAQIADGLDAIHAAGLVHRDVKPANVLLSGGEGSEHAYITDFGVARNVATASGLTQTGRFVGTLDYVAPEQISGGTVDARVDVYALGCLLFKLLTGEVPFPRDGEAARLYAHLNDPPPAPSLYAPGVPMALDDVVARALSKEPDDRYPSAGDLGRAAEAALSGAPVAVPEHTVATGAAATRETATAPTRAAEPTASTNRVEPGSGPGGGRRRLLLAAGAAAAVLIAVAAIALSGGGGGDGSGGEATATTTREEAPKKKPKPEARPLSEAQLIERADRICTESKDRYNAIRDPESEFSADVLYAEELVRIARPRIRDLRQLDPPPALAGPYREYVEAQERVLRTDEEAVAAARQEDDAGVEAARAQRDSEDDLREQLAREIGLEVCSVRQ